MTASTVLPTTPRLARAVAGAMLHLGMENDLRRLAQIDSPTKWFERLHWYISRATVRGYAPDDYGNEHWQLYAMLQDPSRRKLFFKFRSTFIMEVTSALAGFRRE